MLETAWESRWLPDLPKKEEEIPVVMRLGETPVPIPNTMVKT